MSRKSEAQSRKRYARNQRRKAELRAVPDTPTRKPTVLLAVPTLDGDVNWTIAHMFAGAMLANFRTDFPVQFGTHFQAGTNPVEFARNTIVEEFLDKTSFDWLMMIDADQVVPQNFWHLTGVRDAQIVSGLTYTWVGNAFEAGRLRVNQYGIDDKSRCFNLPVPDDVVTNGQPYFVPVVGTGCIAIRREVFRPKEEGGLGRNPFYFTRHPNGKTIGGEDINFSVDAQRAGFKIAVHPGVRFGHVKKMDIAQVDEFYRARKIFDAAGVQFTTEQLLSVA